MQNVVHMPIRPSQGPLQGRADHRFVGMLNAYRDTGGLARADEVVALSQRVAGPDVASIARCIVERTMISFEWDSDLWLPLFQFNRMNMTPKPHAVQVVVELIPVFASWPMAEWFSCPHASLANRAPVDVIGQDFSAVLGLARAERALASR